MPLVAAGCPGLAFVAEHYTRRPVTALAGLGATVEASERSRQGAIERVHARKPG